MPDPNDPLGLMSDDPLGILGDVPAAVPSVPMHIQRPVAPPPVAQAPTHTPLALGQTAWQKSRTANAAKNEAERGKAPIGTELLQSAKGGLSQAMLALRTPFVQEPVMIGTYDAAPPYMGYSFPVLKPNPRYGMEDPAQQTLRDLDRESQIDLEAAGGGTGLDTIVRGGIGMVPYFNPITGAASGAGTAMEQGKSGLGIAVNTALGGAFGPVAAGPVRAIQALTRAPSVVATGLGGAMAGAGSMALTGLETKYLERPELAELADQELGAVAPAAGIGGGLASIFDVRAKGRGSFRRPMDLRAPVEPAPIDVPILEPKPPGVDSLLPPDVIARMKSEPIERNLLSEQSRPLTEVPEPPPGVDAYFPPEVIARMKSAPVERNLSPVEAPPTEVPPAPPGVDSYLPPEVIARMKGAGRETPEDPLGILPPGPHPGNILPEFAPTDPAGTAPIVTASGTPRLPPMELKPTDAIPVRSRRPGEADPDAQTQEISPEIVADLNRRAEAADRAQYAKQMERAAQRSRGETPEWKAQREEWAAQAKRDSTPEARAAEAADLADIQARNSPPTKTSTGVDTAIDTRGESRNLFDSEAAPAPLASWFNDLATADKMGSTPLARKPVDIVPETRSATGPSIVPITPGKAKGSDFNRGGFITKSQAAERAKAEVSDPNAETRQVTPVDPVEAHIRSLPEADQAPAREAVKGWDGKSDPEGMIANIKMAVDGPRELARRKAARLAAKEKANAAPRPPQEKAPETPGQEVRGAAEPTAIPGEGDTGTTSGRPAVRPGQPSETRTPDVADAVSPDPVRTALDTKQPPTPSENLGGRNNTRRGAAVNPIDEVAKLVDKGVGAIGRVAKRASDEISDGEGIASVPARALRTYEASLEQVVDRKGGEIGKEFAARARATNDRARQLEGELAPLLRKAQSTVSSLSPKGRRTANELMKIEWDGDFGTSRSHSVAEGKTAPSAHEAEWAKSHQDLFYASGKQAEDAGVMQRQANGTEIPFKADKNRKEAIRAPEDALHYYADHPGTPDARKLFTHVAEKNDMTLEQFEKLAKTAFGERSLERPAALEQARGLKYFPTHMKTADGDIVPLLKSNPLKMVEALATRTPQRVAFHDKFGGEDPKVGVAEYEKAGGDRAAAENLFLALSGSPLEVPGTGFKPGSGLDTFSRRLGMFMGVLRSSSLSVSAAMNAPESLAKTFPMAGVKTYARAVKSLFRHPKDAQQEMENIGAMAAHEFNWHLEPGRKGEQVERIMRDVLGMPLHIVEQKNVTLAALAGYIKAGDLKAGKGTMFDRVRLNWLGFKKPEIDALMNGTATPEQYQAVVTRYPEWTQGHATRGPENSRIAHSKWYQRLTIAERFPRLTVNRFARAIKSIPELWKQGEKGQAAAAATLLAGMGMTHAASGAAGLLIRSALMWQLGSATSSLVQGEEKTQAWKDFLWKSLAGALFGPSSQAVGTVGSMAAGLGENDKSLPAVLASPIYPLSVVENVVNFATAMAGKEALPGSPFKDLNRADAAVKFLEMRLPLTKVAASAAGALGLGERDPEMDGAMTAFWNWRRKYAPFEGTSGPSNYSEFRVAAKKAARMVQDGKDPSPYLEEALQAKATEIPERQEAAAQKARMEGRKYKRPDTRTEAFNSLADSLKQRRVLDDLTSEQKKAAADYLGPATFERLSTYDRLLEAWAQRLKDAR